MKLLAKAIGSKKANQFWLDPVLFIRAFDRPLWDFQEDIIKEITERDYEGRFIKRLAVASLPRQNSKTTMSGWVSLWRLFCDPDDQEIVSIANDRAQASIQLRDARRIISASPVLSSLLDEHGLTRSEIRLKDGRRWLIKSSDSVSSRGLRPSHLAYDELGFAPDSELFNVLLAGQGAQRNPLCVVTSTVTGPQYGPLWELFELARERDPSIRLIYYQENLSPLISQEYLDQELALLPTIIYNREHNNAWGSGEDSFATLEDWEAAIEAGDPRESHETAATFGYLDLGWVHDETALAVGKLNDDKKIQIVHLEIWQGSQTSPVQFDAIEGRLIELADRLNIRRLKVESPQGVALSQRLIKAGVNSEVLHPTSKSQREIWGALYIAIKKHQVWLPNDAKLRRQLLTLTIKDSPTGWKIIDDPRVHNDRALACAGVVNLIKIGGPPQPLTEGITKKSTWIVEGVTPVPQPGKSRWKL